jgi:hypothetical protein
MLGFTGNKGLASESLRVNCFFAQYRDRMVWGEKHRSLKKADSAIKACSKVYPMVPAYW